MKYRLAGVCRRLSRVAILVSVVGWSLHAGGARAARGEPDWPKGYTLCNSESPVTSPDGVLGFIIPNYDGYRKGDRCRLVNLKTGTVVHQIEHGEYWTDLSHGGISPSWKRDPAHPGGWHCVVEFFGKWQPRNVTLLEIGPGSRCVETDIWALVESDTARRFRGTIPDRSFNDYYAFMLTETQIQWEGAEAFVIKAILDSNPKDLTDKPKHSCQVTARYDVRRHSLKVTTGKLEVRKAPPSGR